MQRGPKPKTMIKDGKCRFYTKGKDGFCVHYAGSRKMVSGCFDKCLRQVSRTTEGVK